MRVILVQPKKEPELVEIGGRLKDLQDAVGGYIEAIYPFDDEVCLICNEEGKLLGMEPNRPLYDEHGNVYDVICGPFIVAGLTEDNFGSLTATQAVAYMEKFSLKS